jgi:hypothetical protein
VDGLTRLKAACRTRAGIGWVSGLDPSRSADAREFARTSHLNHGRSLTDHFGVSLQELDALAERV